MLPSAVIQEIIRDKMSLNPEMDRSQYIAISLAAIVEYLDNQYKESEG